MARPNPKYDPVTGATTTPTTPKEARPNPRYGTGVDQFVNIGGYARNLVLEERLKIAMHEAEQYNTQFKNYMNPVDTPVPSWWEDSGAHHPTRWRQHYTDEEAIEYLERGKKYLQARINIMAYECDYYPKEPRQCQNVVQKHGIMNSINALIEKIKADRLLYPVNGEPFEFLPQVSAEEEIITNGVMEPAPILEPTPQPVTFTPIPEPINESITDNMVTQQIDYFTIENGRAIGQITFTATQNFNPFWYNKTITNLIQFKDRNGVNILPTVKQNNLRFTETERTETIQYNEGMNDNIYSKVSSFVWTSATLPTAFSKQSEFEIREKEPVKPIASGFMAAGVAGAIAGLILIGFIADYRGGK